MRRSTSPPCRLSFALFLSLLLLPCCLFAATISSIEVLQLSFQGEDASSRFVASEYAEFRISYETGPLPQFLNVQAMLPGSLEDPVWIVRNLFLRDLSSEPPLEQLSQQFSLEELGVNPGIEVEEILIGFSLQDRPLLDVYFSTWSAAVGVGLLLPVMPSTISFGAVDLAVSAAVPEGTAPSHGTHTAPDTSEVYSSWGCQVPNIDLGSTGSGAHPEDWGACGPASCANSLHWLKDHPQPGDPAIQFPSSLRETFGQLSRLMNRNPPYGGVFPRDMVRAKLDFAEAHGLPLRVKYQSVVQGDNGDVKSSSGKSTGKLENGSSGQAITKEWLAQQAKDGEDVELSVHWWYTDAGGVGHWGPGHFVVLTGMGETAGKTWLRFKDDKRQDYVNPDSLRHGNSDLVLKDGYYYVPGLNGKVNVPPGSSNWFDGKAIVTGAVAESPDATVTPPAGGETYGRYCQSVKRTIPKGGKLEVTYPSDGNRCYNSQLYVLDRTHTPPQKKIARAWNFNRGKKRVYSNPYDYPVTVELHNDDHGGSTTPYPGFGVNLNVVQPSSSKLAEDDPSNWEAYGGFSLGAHDSLWDDFSPVELGTMVNLGPIGDGFSLDQVPSHLGEMAGTQELWLNTDVPAWNPYWEHLGVLIAAGEVSQPGDLLVECPSTGSSDVVSITAIGRYELDLGVMPPQAQFQLRLVAQNGLDMQLDCLGVPSLVEGVPVSAPVLRRPVAAFLEHNHPNPFNPITTIRFGVPRSGHLSLIVYDLRGRKVRTLFEGYRPAGSFEERWDGRDEDGRPVVSGTYLYKLRTENEVLSRKMSLVR
jgi:hypothetical protein